MMSKSRIAKNQSALCICLALLLAGAASATSTKLFQQGNKAYAEERFDDAVNRYMEAVAESPESAEIYYNLGNAQYRAGTFEEAAATFELAASIAETDALRSQCWYNLGNCMVKAGEALREEDRNAAVSYCRQAAWCFRAALDYNPDFAHAAYNLEMTRLISATIEEEIRKEQEKEQQENELIKYIREKLTEFIERQTKLIEQQTTGEAQKLLSRIPARWQT